MLPAICGVCQGIGEARSMVYVRAVAAGERTLVCSVECLRIVRVARSER